VSEATRPPPLAGVRVLDLSRLLPGPLCAQHLADLGAHVIKIEDPKVGDYVRPAIRNLANRGKEGLTLDLKSAAGRDIFLRLLDSSDVVLESFRPGVMARLGLGYDTLAARRPSIVHCAITGYGQSGPRSAAAGHDINYLGLSGVLDQTGAEGGAPVIPGFLISDILGGTLTAAMGILAALVDARATGKGRFVDVSMADAVMAHCVLPAAELNEHGHAHPRGQGPHTGGKPRYNVYAARDGRYIAVGAQEKKFWDTLCDALGMPALKPKHDPAPGEAADVHAALARAFATRDAADWLATLEPLDCCVGPVLTVEEALAHPGFAARGTVAREGNAVALGLPLAMSGHRVPFERRSPARGEHTEAILGRLGFASAEIGALRDQGVV
jgi:crotonobetainyl-CoA:carnitine CoA-transferase CaiB-like acyl-CoA transferase